MPSSRPQHDVRVLEVVHQGARSVVYRAIRTADGLPIILKVARADAGGVVGGDLEHEMAIARQIDSPSVVKAHQLTTFEGQPALMLEDGGGRSLDRLLRVPLPVDTFLRLAIGLAHALAEVHRLGVIHRDVKPSNVIVDAAGEVKLTDFGIASARRSEPTVGELVGTLAYAAPEQSGQLGRTVDQRSDLYSVGVSLYEMLTGERPFHGNDALEWIHSHLARTPRPPDEIAQGIPKMLSAIILRLLAKSPEKRYQSATGLEHDLRRCLEAWIKTTSIAPFPLALADVSRDFRILQRLYGREREVGELGRLFARCVGTRSPVLALIAGDAGVGKSALVSELRGHVAQGSGFFCVGKFDQGHRNVPFTALAGALEELVKQLLSLSPERLAVWVEAFDGNLGSSWNVLVEVFPVLARVLAARVPVTELAPAEALNRLKLAFATFLRVLASHGRPIVVFLDDLQWADAASLELFEAAASASAGTLLFVLAYRPGEVEIAHPFRTMVERLRAADVAIEEVAVGPLSAACVEELVAETLRGSADLARPLARLVMDKTAGNPFFVGEFLRTLHLEGRLTFDEATRRWRWDQAAIEAMAITDNVVELMLGRLRKLSPATRHALELAACLGNTFDVGRLALIAGASPAAIDTALGDALDQGLLLRVPGDGVVRYRFNHDRIQQAAYALIDEDRRAEVHLGIGRLLAGRGDEEVEAELFEIVNHLDTAIARIDAPEERARLAELNLRAARKARRATAHEQARVYFSTALDLTPPDAWRSRHAEIFEVATELAECEYLSGHLDRARERLAELETRASTDLERGAIHNRQMKLFQVAGDFERATAIALGALERLGLQAPSGEAEIARAVAAEFAEADRLLAGRPIATIYDAPPMNDPVLRMTVELLEASGPPIYMVVPPLFPWIVLKMVTLSLRHGTCDASCYGYAVYGLLRAAALGDVDGGQELASLAIRLEARVGDGRLTGCMLHMLGDHINFWKHPIATDLPILERGFAACIAGGDLIYSNYIGFQAPWHAYEAGLPLGQVWAMTERFADFAVRSKYRAVYLTIRLEQQHVLDLQGRTERRGSLCDADFDDAAALVEIEAARFGCGVVTCHVLRMVSRFTYGDTAGALEAARLAEPVLGAAFSMPLHVTFILYRALTLAALHRSLDAAGRAHAERTVRAAVEDLTRWSHGCPSNFAHQAELVRAELARMTGDLGEAMRAYEAAIGGAREQGIVHLEALACERAADLYLTSGATSLGLRLLQEAQALYRVWGAIGKAAYLDQLHPGLAIHASRRTTGLDTASAGRTLPTPGTSQRTGEAVDLLPVVKAAQSLSAEMVLPRLLERLMTIVLEYTGAERGWLMLTAGGELTVAAHAEVDRRGPAPPVDLVPTEVELPWSILRYVERTHELVRLEDASQPNPYSGDPYLEAHQRRSILCVPIVRLGKLTGMFYLENNLLAGAFRAERLVALEVLAAQTAISIDNSRLYDRSQEAIQLRDEFLSIASHELKTPLTPLRLRLEALVEYAREGTLDGVTSDRIARLAESSTTQLLRLTRLIDALLDVSRIQLGELSLVIEPTDLAAIATAVVEQTEGALAAMRCTVSLDAPEPVLGTWDRVHLEQAITNLVLNATKYAPGTPIEISVEGSGDRARLAVVDHGIGIAAEDLSRIFERFERVRSATNVGGLGLGLFLARQIIVAHGGTLEVQSRPGVGTSFVIDLPRTPPPESAT